MTVHFEGKFFEHEQGTKFYEVFQIWNADEGVFLMVKRWGKMGSTGEVQVLPCRNHRVMEAEAHKLIQQKEKRGYFNTPASFGLFGLRSVKTDELSHAFSVHYGVNSGKIAQHFNLLAGQEATTVIVDEASDIVVEEPTPEPERGGSWGSW